VLVAEESCERNVVEVVMFGQRGRGSGQSDTYTAPQSGKIKQNGVCGHSNGGDEYEPHSTRFLLKTS
jgi:hypothetical protein